MKRKFVSATISAALCVMSVWPGIAAAQEYRSTGVEAPQGITATVNVRVPLGRDRNPRPSYGLTFGYGQTWAPGYDGRVQTRSINFADFRLNEDLELRNARLAGFDLANPGRDRRLNLTGAGKKTWLILGILIAAGVIICVTELCEDDDEDIPNSPGTSTPGG
jgi:hypothetical protein